MRFRNTTGYTRDVADAGVTVPPGGEFDWPGYDPAVHGTVPGCEPRPAVKGRRGGGVGTSGEPAVPDPDPVREPAGDGSEETPA